MEHAPKTESINQHEAEENELSDAAKEAAGEKVLRISFAEWKEGKKDEVKKEIEYYSGEIAEIQSFFRAKIQRDREAGKGEMPEKEFTRWEGDYADQWKYIQNQLTRLKLGTGNQESMEFEAEAEKIMFVSEDNLGETIEAQAGRFFEERSHALRDAIQESDSETKTEDLNTLGSFLTSVAEHLDYRYISYAEMRNSYGDSEYDMKRFDKRRTEAHNHAIEHLNKLNQLARKYETTPFIARDLWTSENQRQTPHMSKRMSYDRHVFEAYYTHAFGNLVDKIKSEHEQYDRY